MLASWGPLKIKAGTAKDKSGMAFRKESKI